MSITEKTRTFAPCPYGDGYGITLREYFAGLAMANMAVSHSPSGYDYSRPGMSKDAAQAAVAYADALLAALAKDKPRE